MKDWKEIIIETNDGELIADISANSDEPVICKDGYRVRIVPTDKAQLSTESTTFEWIPVSERLPEYHDEVLITSRGEVGIAWRYIDNRWRSNDFLEELLNDIVAWMPLPEPYTPPK